MATYQELYDELKDDPVALQAAIEEAVRIDQQAMLFDLLRQAQVFATWGFLLALADTEAKRLRLRMEEEVLPAARQQAEAVLKEQDRKATVQAKDDLARQDKNYKAAQHAFLLANERASVFKRVVEALSHKRDMLQSLNSRAKVELGALPQEDFSWMGEDPHDHKAHDHRRSDYRLEPEPQPSYNDPQEVDSQVADLAKKWRTARREKRTG